jgi:hypothetical protein
MHTIKKVEYLKDYKLLLTFNDKKRKIVDLEKYSKEGPETVFYPFRDLEFFKSVTVDNHTGTIVWPNGVDLCPDVLYERGEEIDEAKKSPIKTRSRSIMRKKKSTTIKATAMAKRIAKKVKKKS